MKKQIKLTWKKEECTLPNHTQYVAFVGHVEMDYKIYIAKDGSVYLGILQTEMDILKTHTEVYPSYPMMNDNTVFNFVLIPDKSSNSGSEAKNTTIDIAKKIAQNMFNQKVKSLRNMMRIIKE